MLIALGLPTLGIQLGSARRRTDPSSFTTRRAYDLLSRASGPVSTAPDPGRLHPRRRRRSTLDKLQTALEGTPGVAEVSSPRFNDAGTAAILTVSPSTSPAGQRTGDLIATLRDRVIPGAVRARGSRSTSAAPLRSASTSRSISPTGCRSSSAR